MIGLIISVKNIFSRILEIALMIMVAALTCDVLWGVISRFAGKEITDYANKTGWVPWSWLPLGQSKWTEELAIILLIWVSLLGASVAFGAKAHLGVDYFVGKLDKDARRMMEILVQIIVIFFTGLVMVWGGYELVAETLQKNQLSPAMGIKWGYVYLALPISGALIIMYALEDIVEVLAGPEGQETKSADQA